MLATMGYVSSETFTVADKKKTNSLPPIKHQSSLGEAQQSQQQSFGMIKGPSSSSFRSTKKLPSIFQQHKIHYIHNQQKSLFDLNHNHLLKKGSPSQFQSCSDKTIILLDFKDLEKQSKKDSLKYVNTTSEKSPTSSSSLTLKVFVAAFVSFFTNSFASGYNLGVLNTPEQILKAFFNNTLNLSRTELIDAQQIELIWSIAVSILVIGALVTSIITGYLADLMGRRSVIFLNATIGLLAMGLTWSSKYISNISVFMIGRLLAGFHTGIASSIVPMYLMEIGPKNLQSSMGAVHVLGLNGGLFIAQFFGLETIFGTISRWPLLFFVNAVFITLGMMALYFMPESPVFLYVIRKREDKAIEVLQRLRQKPISELTDDINVLKQEQKSKECTNGSFLQLLKQRSFRRNLLIVCALHAGQQLIGINAVFYYSTNTFRSVGFSQTLSQMGSIGCSLLNTISSFLALRLLKTFSPRKLILVSAIGTSMFLLILPVSMTFKTELSWLNYVTVGTILLYVFMFAIGQGPIPYMIGGQLFDSGSMGIGLSCGCFINWFCNFLIALTFPMLVIYTNQFVFLIFFAFNLLVLLFIIFFVPEIKPADSHFDRVKE